MAETHPYIGELTRENVDKYLTGLTRKQVARIIAADEGINASQVVARADVLGVSIRDVVEAMVADGQLARRRGGLYMGAENDGF